MRTVARLWILLLMFSGITTLHSGLYAQDIKYKVRVSLNYMKIMPETSLLTITAKYKGEDGFMPATNLGYDIFNVLEFDSLVLLGQTKTNKEGIAVFPLKDLGSIASDSTGTYHFLAASLEHPQYQLVEKDIDFRDTQLQISIDTEQGINNLNATLTDTFTGEALEGLPLRVQVQRLFRPLRIGDDFYITDDSGSVKVGVEPGIPGLNGRLALEVILLDEDPYGTVKVVIEESLGTPIDATSTFDQRTMWGPPSKTPLFLLTFPNLLLLGIWGAIVMLIVNLFKINNSKNP